jgi:hypothetical protein
MSSQTATVLQAAKASVPVKRLDTGDVFDRIQNTLQETEQESKKHETVYPNETI